jgi:hypothetical protein
MIRTAEAYRQGLRDNRRVWIGIGRARGLTQHAPGSDGLLDSVRRAAPLSDDVTIPLS